jgi:hypothetical protein
MRVSSVVCRYEDWNADWFKSWAKRFGLPIDGPPHRKHWEFCALAQALEERGFLKPGNCGLSFASGREWLPSMFAACGCNILATDLADEGKWQGQHASSLDDLFYEWIVDRDTFDRHVKFQPTDMTNIRGIDREKFDFLWSTCSLEHLGSIDAGIQFIANSMDHVKKGGIAVHTTEFNISSNDDTLLSGDCVIYRRKDIQKLNDVLRKKRCGLEFPNFDAGCHPYDLDYDVPPFMQPGKPHIKLELGGFVSTSILLVCHKA